MPALLLRFLPHLLAVVGLICLGLWLRHSGHQAGEREVQSKWDQERTAQTAAALGALQSAIERDAAERKVREQEAILANGTLMQSLNAIESRSAASAVSYRSRSMQTPSVRSGLVSLCAVMLVGCASRPAAPVTVEIPGPVRYVTVPASCLMPLSLSDPIPQTNGDLLQLLASYRARIEQANSQLDCVRALQPK